jgi:hypothetical protein
MWQHSPITGKVGIFAIMDSRGKAMTRILWLMHTNGVG